MYGVPFDSGSAGLFYRIDILEAAGFTPEDLEDITWPEMIEIAKAVKEKTGKYAFQFIPSECAFTWFDSAMQSSGTWFYDENEEDVYKRQVHNSARAAAANGRDDK